MFEIQESEGDTTMAIMYIGEINETIWSLIAEIAEILAFRHGGTSSDWLKTMQKTRYFTLLLDRKTGLMNEGSPFLAREFEKELGLKHVDKMIDWKKTKWSPIDAQAEIVFELYNTCRLSKEQVTELLEKSTILERARDAYELVFMDGAQQFLSDIRASIKKECGIGYRVQRRHNENKQVRV